MSNATSKLPVPTPTAVAKTAGDSAAETAVVPRTPTEFRLPDVSPTLVQASVPTWSSQAPAASPPEGSATPPPRTMPSDFSIAIAPGTGKPKRGALAGRRQPMRGYEVRFTDIVDYCVDVTDRIWEDQDVGYIYDTYANGVRIHDDRGWKYGVEAVVEGTIATINAFPDSRHYADDVIWAGDEDQGFVTSHRALNIGHHTGPYKWAPQPTGKEIRIWVIANCVSKENLFYEEWVLYNTAARLLQLGVNVTEAAQTYAIAGGARLDDHQLSEVDRLLSGRKPTRYELPPAGAFNVEHAVRALFHDVYNRRDFSAIDRLYSQSVRWHGTSNREGRGRSAVRGMARNLLATFPDLGLSVDEVYWMGNDDDGYSVSVRWSAAGTHRGLGLYGAPTNRRAFVWGISQLYFQQGRIVEDWSLFNEFDVIAQLIGQPEAVSLA
ncbi:hypothetical protein E3O06_11345 [Cryobacterium glaciale]|uniref:Ester cyclase n=1 Tax=Cryobacterium glaciale TaxID=1259145 RepID=A0A4R8UTV7_9MICO|nr:ester cyclase [Cryobacterium glaciale]TFB71851.1 hypothetical protein E3O06_11345 [Cryobacterium glaciale]